MDKLKMHSPNITQANIAKLAELFPNCVTEAKDESGNLKQAIDFDLLRQELSTHIVEGPQERYQLNWPGKREALLTANAPIAKTLRPCRDESVDFDTTRNLFIEGDNLDALKLLQETYLNKVKLIYIDPPYNTGRDFIYRDNFSKSTSEFLIQSNQVDEQGNRLQINAETSGRFHSDWLSMLYSRLRLARTLLSERGVIFISIDDSEVSNLRKICDEVFGEEQFAAQIIWKKRNTPPNDKVIGAQHDYILVYVKSNINALNLRPRSEDQISRYKNPDNHPKGPWASGDLSSNVKGGRYSAKLSYPIVNPRTGKEHWPSNNGNWRFSRDRVEALIAEDEIYFGKDDQSAPKLKRFLCDVKDGATWTTLWDFAPFNTSGSLEMGEIFGNTVIFENPKPIGLLKHVLQAGSDPDSIVLDFFAGSASTAHAVMQLNSEDNGNRRFIMIQLPEIVGNDTEAFKAGFKTIAETSKARIRLASEAIEQDVAKKSIESNAKDLLSECSDPANLLDLGFRVLKIDTSNMNEVYYTPDAVSQADLLNQIDNIRPDRTPEDLLFQVLLDWGVDLALPIHRETIAGKTVFFVDGAETNMALAACFDTGITEDFVKTLAKRQPLRVVFRDAGFAGDSVKINVEQIFKLMSPNTDVKTL